MYSCSVQCVLIFPSLSPVFPEPSLTPQNLSTVLHSLEDAEWKAFGIYANMPGSELEKIRFQFASGRERKQAIIHSVISDHPAPSWDLVAYALYRVCTDSSHKALEHLQQRFPTGTHVYNYYLHVYTDYLHVHKMCM